MVYHFTICVLKCFQVISCLKIVDKKKKKRKSRLRDASGISYDDDDDDLIIIHHHRMKNRFRCFGVMNTHTQRQHH